MPNTLYVIVIHILCITEHFFVWLILFIGRAAPGYDSDSLGQCKSKCHVVVGSDGIDSSEHESDAAGFATRTGLRLRTGLQNHHRSNGIMPVLLYNLYFLAVRSSISVLACSSDRALLLTNHLAWVARDNAKTLTCLW